MADLTKFTPRTQFEPKERLLPENRTKLEADEAVVQHRTDDVQVPYRDLMDPYKTPASFLPWLAGNWAIDLWYDDWDETRRRDIIANAVPLKRGKGKPIGIKNYLSYVDATVQKMVRPPAKAFYRGAMTDASRLSFLENLPQIRLYPYKTRRIHPKARAFFRRSQYQSEGLSFYGASFEETSYGPQIYGKKAYFIDPLRPDIPPAQVSYTSYTDPTNPLLIEQVLINFSGSKRVFYGQNAFSVATGINTRKRFFTQTSRAATNVLSVRLSDNASQLYATFSGDVTTDVRPQREYVQRMPQSRAFLNVGLTFPSYYGRSGRKYGFYRTSVASDYIYDRISIYDASRLAVERRARSFYNHARFGIAAFTSEVYISFPMKRSKFRSAKFYGIWYMKGWDATPLNRALDAIHISKSGRDKILVQTQLHQKVRLSSRLHLGSFKLGQTVSTI